MGKNNICNEDLKYLHLKVLSLNRKEKRDDFIK